MLGATMVFRACRVLTCWIAARFRATHWNAARVPDQHADFLAPRLAALLRMNCSARTGPLLPAVNCWQERSSAASVRCLDSPRSSDDHFDRNLCSPPKHFRPGDLRDDHLDVPQ